MVLLRRGIARAAPAPSRFGSIPTTGTVTSFKDLPNPISGALYQGPDPNNPNWDNSWTVGRGQFGGGVADFFDGRIDEVRITNIGASLSQFLFRPARPAGRLATSTKTESRCGGLRSLAKNETANTALPNDDGATTQAARFDLWRANFGEMEVPGSGGSTSAIPEPGSFVLAILAIGMFFGASPGSGIVDADIRCREEGIRSLSTVVGRLL